MRRSHCWRVKSFLNSPKEVQRSCSEVCHKVSCTAGQNRIYFSQSGVEPLLASRPTNINILWRAQVMLGRSILISIAFLILGTAASAQITVTIGNGGNVCRGTGWNNCNRGCNHGYVQAPAPVAVYQPRPVVYARPPHRGKRKSQWRRGNHYQPVHVVRPVPVVYAPRGCR